MNFQITRGDVQIPKWLSPGAQKMIKRIIDPNSVTRITISEIKADDWFRQGYIPSNPDDDEDNVFIDEEAFSINEVQSDGEKSPGFPTLNAFQLIGMSSYLDLSGFFEQEDIFERKIRFTSNLSHMELLESIENIVTGMGYCVQKKNGRLKVVQKKKYQNQGSLSVAAEVFEISPSLYVVELRKSSGDASIYRQLCKRLSNDLGASGSQELLSQPLLSTETISNVC